MEGYEPLLFLAATTGELPVKGEKEALYGDPLRELGLILRAFS